VEEQEDNSDASPPKKDVQPKREQSTSPHQARNAAMPMGMPMTNGNGHAGLSHYPGGFTPVNMMAYPGMPYMSAGSMELSNLAYQYAASQGASFGHFGYDAAGNFGSLPPPVGHHPMTSVDPMAQAFFESMAEQRAMHAAPSANSTNHTNQTVDSASSQDTRIAATRPVPSNCADEDDGEGPDDE
jgi:hypothetical protein